MPWHRHGCATARFCPPTTTVGVVFDYVTDVSGWEPWQREYRYGAIYVFPPNGIIEAIDELRARYDPMSHAICHAHVSVSEPFPRAVTDTDVEQLRAGVARIEPFEVSYGQPFATTPHPGVVYRIDPQAAFAGLRARLHALPTFDGVELRREGVPAHMTIAEFLTVAESEALASQLAGTVPEGTWTCDEVEYAIPDIGFTFRRVATFPLAGGGPVSL